MLLFTSHNTIALIFLVKKNYRLSWGPDSLLVDILLAGDRSDKGSALRFIPDLTKQKYFYIFKVMRYTKQKYSGNPKTRHSNTGNIRKSDILTSGFQMVENVLFSNTNSKPYKNVRFLNGPDKKLLIFEWLPIRKPYYLWSDHLSTIQKPDMSDFRIPTVFTFLHLQSDEIWRWDLSRLKICYTVGIRIFNMIGIQVVANVASSKCKFPFIWENPPPNPLLGVLSLV